MEYFIDFLKFYLFITLPQTILIYLFCFSFVSPEPRNLLRRVLLMSFLHATYTNALMEVLPLHFHFLNAIAFAVFLMFVLFRELRPRTKIGLVFFVYLMALLSDLLFSACIIYLWGLPAESEMLRQNIPLTASVYYPQFLILLAAGWTLRRSNFFAVKRIFSIMTEESRGTLIQVVIVVIAQAMLLGLYQLTEISSVKLSIPSKEWLIYASIALSFLTFAAIVRLLVNTKERAFRSTQEAYIEDINDMFTSIRGQRHDFLNHLQVIHTMAQMNRTQQLKTYLGELVVETREVSAIVNHASPALAAFAHAKMTVAAGRGIPLIFELPADWKAQESSIKVIDIIKILGHLIDHAFEELLPPYSSHGQIEVRILSEDGSLTLRVSVVGDLASAQRPTKNDESTEHAELRLAIVMDRVKHYKGTFDERTAPGSDSPVVYEVHLPQFHNLLV